MADQPVTREKLINADIDVDNLGKAVNELGVVNPRYGNSYKTIPQIAREYDENSGTKGFNTLAEFEAVKFTIPAHTVINIGEAGPNQGQNFWNGTTLTKSAYDPLTQAKNYADANAVFKPVRVDADTPRSTFIKEGIYIVPQDVIATALGLPEAARGEIISTGKTRASNYTVHSAFFTENGSVYHSFYNGNTGQWTDWKGFDGRFALQSGDVAYKKVLPEDVPDLNTHTEECQIFVQRSTHATVEKGYPFQQAGYLIQSKNFEGTWYQSYLSKSGHAMRWGILGGDAINWRPWSGFKSENSIIDLDTIFQSSNVSDSLASSYVNFWNDEYYLSRMSVGATSNMRVDKDSLNDKPVYKLSITNIASTKYAVWYLDDFPKEAFYAAFLIYSEKAENVQSSLFSRLRLRRTSDNDNIEIYPEISSVGDNYYLLRYVVENVDEDRDMLVVSFDVTGPEVGDWFYLVDGYIGVSKISKFEDRKYLYSASSQQVVDSSAFQKSVESGKLVMNKNGQVVDVESVFDYASFWGSSTIMLMQPFITTAMQANGIPNCIERGKGAEWVEHTSTRFGSYEMIANPRTTGGVIPASGSVAITSNLPTYTLEHMLPFDAEIAGIAGHISFDSSIGAQIFTRSESGEATAFKDAVVTPVYDQTYRNGVIIINVGKNNFTMGAASGNAHLASPEHVFKETVKMYEHCRSAFKKVLILDNFVNGSTPAESTIRDSIVECNRLLKEKFGDLLISSYDYLIGDIFPDTNTTPTAADLEQIGLKNLPPSMRIDNGHLNDKANQAIVGNLIIPRMRKFGWID